MAGSAVAARRSGDQWLLWTASVEESDHDGCACLLRRHFCHGAIPGCGLFVGFRSLLLQSGALDSFGKLSGRFQFLSRSVVAGHAAGSYGRRIFDSHLFGWVHVGRRWVLPFHVLSEPVHVLHADAGAGEELSGDVYRVGGRGPGVVSVDWLLVHQRFGSGGWQEGFHRQPHWRLWIPDRAVPHDPALWVAGFHPSFQCGTTAPSRDDWSRSAHSNWVIADGGGGGKIRADSSLYLAA